MKKALLFSFLVFIMASCNNTKPPTDVAKEFIQAISSSDPSTASELVTEKTKSNVGTAKGDASGMTASINRRPVAADPFVGDRRRPPCPRDLPRGDLPRALRPREIAPR